MTIGAIPETMKAVTLVKAFDIKVADVPTPKIEKDTDVVIKVTTAGLCGTLWGPRSDNSETDNVHQDRTSTSTADISLRSPE